MKTCQLDLFDLFDLFVSFHSHGIIFAEHEDMSSIRNVWKPGIGNVVFSWSHVVYPVSSKKSQQQHRGFLHSFPFVEARASPAKTKGHQTAAQRRGFASEQKMEKM